MKKHILLLFGMFLFLYTMLMPVSVCADTLETEKECSLSLSYKIEDRKFENLEISIDRIASVMPDGTYVMVAPYSSYPVNIHGITSQTEWKNTAETLMSYVVADKVVPYRTGQTDEEGCVLFTGLETGLYLVRNVIADYDTGTSLFQEFMIYLPTPSDDGSFVYDMKAIPKPVKLSEKKEYAVMKQWKDSGYEDQRPDEVLIELYKDGIYKETVLLNVSNNWSYVWKDTDGTGIWTAVEKNAPDGYEVTVTTKGNRLIVTNTYIAPEEPDKPDTPKTGDTTPIWAYIILLCISGMGLLVLGMFMTKRGKDNKKRR